ncbi:MAG: DUF5916 domain-containing protein, partial [Bacteroidota bacterium]|nr:DUF5916 domain-containing protein [Bacteroidota bacterium]
AEIKKPALLEVLPYTVGTSSYYPKTVFRERVAKFRPDVGADIKYGVTSNFTLDLTVNPDFAQVEADPEVLNLTTFETFYPEKRPFFIEGTQILRFTTFGGDFGPGLFYSRRIGKAIAVEPPPGGVITDEPRSATILGAAKLTGKTQQGTSIGVLTALTNEEQFTFRDSLGTLHTQLAEPRASYNLFRIKQDFGGNSNVGAIITGVSRDTRSPAYASGADWNVYFDNSTYRLDGFFAHSQFLTTTDERREGNAGKAHFGKVSGNWLFDLSTDFTSRKYFINDMGFFFSPNDYGANAGITYRELEPGEIFRSYRISPSIQLRWNYDHLTLFQVGELDAQVQLLNYWSINATVTHSAPAKDPYEPFFYGAYNAPEKLTLRGEVQSDIRKSVIVDVAENITLDRDGQHTFNTGTTMIVRPVTSMEYQLTLNYNRERHRTSFAKVITDSVLTFAPSSPVALFGIRDIDHLDLTLRSSILFTHELSLQIYNQLFWAKGQYKNFSVLPPSGDLLPYTFSGNVDFNRTSLISNVVLRWEYREGSTFYFVWSHGRQFFQRGGYGTDFATNVDNTFLAAPDNVYVVKLSYWLNL